jgi:hypothetical protein
MVLVYHPLTAVTKYCKGVTFHEIRPKKEPCTHAALQAWCHGTRRGVTDWVQHACVGVPRGGGRSATSSYRGPRPRITRTMAASSDLGLAGAQVVDMTGVVPEVIRRGKGDTSMFEGSD